MAKIPGRLIVDLFPDVTVRMVFIANTGGGNEVHLHCVASQILT